jgi:hypothetical protein
VHCIPLATTTTYDLVLTPTHTGVHHALPAFPRVHHAKWLAAAPPIEVPTSSIPACDESGASASTAAAVDSGGRESQAGKEGQEAISEGSRVSLSEQKGLASTIPEAARFLAPNHVVDLENATHFR